jgi:arylsulfatase A-like enzyme
MTNRPNILFVFTDQQRSTALGCAGVEPVRTPNLDRFAAEGTRFTNAVANTPSCAPSRATLLTGLHTMTHKLVNNDMALREDVPTAFARELKTAGYHTGYIGKWHLGGENRAEFIPPGPRRLGFDDFWAGAECTHSYMDAFYHLNDDPKPRFHEGYEPDGQTAMACEHIAEWAKAEEPFCMFLAWGPPHDPYLEMPDEYLAEYDPNEIDLSPTATDAPPNPLYGPGGGSISREEIAGYYAHMTALDRCFGQLMEKLDALGLRENTLVVFTSDHGDMLWNHGHLRKGQPYRESVGIPLITRWPGHIPAGRTTGAPVSIIDLPPTLLALVGVEIPEAMEGADLSAYFLGDESKAPQAAYINTLVCPAKFPFKAWRGVVTATHTYARDSDGPWVLFDDLADPLQQHNLIDDPASAETQTELESLTQRFLESTDDPFLDARAMADLYYPGHEDMVRPFFYPPEIFAEIERRQNLRGHVTAHG